MNTFKRLEKLQEENVRLKLENKELADRNKSLADELERTKAKAAEMVKTAEAQMKDCEKLRTVYDESIAAARVSQDKYREMYRECLKMVKQMKRRHK